MLHTPGPWLVPLHPTPYDTEYIFGYVEQGIASAWNIRTMTGRENASLIALAPTAPHDCDILGCPGAENKRKLETFGELLKVAKALLGHADLAHNGCQRRGDCSYLATFRPEVMAAIAKAEGKEKSDDRVPR